MSVVILVIMLSLIILVHEAGHYIAAVKCGVMVEEFALGMGPIVWSKKRGDTLFSIRVFPIGGFCKMLGEDGVPEEGESEPALRESDPRAFCNKSINRRMIVLAAGSVMNFALALLVLFITHLTSGISSPVIGGLIEGFPAEKIGLKVGDRIIAVDKTRINIYDDFLFEMDYLKDQPFDITVKRGGEALTFRAEKQYHEEDGEYRLGVLSSVLPGIFDKSGGERINPFEAVSTAFFKMIFWGRATLIMMAQSVADGIMPTLTGPVGLGSIVNTLYKQASGVSGWAAVLSMASFLAYISANVGMLNLFPFPPLDGGRLLFVFIEGVFKKRVSPRKEAAFHFAGMVIMLAIAAVVTFSDILRIINGGTV